MDYPIVILDVRDDIRNGREPFSKIMAAVTGLRANEQLLLIAPFEPVPLFAVLRQRGFTHSARLVGSGDWEVLLTRSPKASTEAAQPAFASTGFGNEAATFKEDILEVDARGLEPPQPMVKILETLAALPAGARLRARTDRRPMHLYPHLEERGFTADTEEETDGSYLTHIRRR